MSKKMDRGDFIKITGAAGLGLYTLGAPAILKGQSQNSKVTVAVIGTNNRGNAHASGFARHPNAEVTYICDVDENAIKKGLDSVKEGGQENEPEGLTDFRNALEDPDLDAVALAMPIHWHAPAAILALKAGKHVYIEKPCSHTPEEGKLLVEAAEKYNRIVQMGNQRRSWPNVMEAMSLLEDDIIGRPYFARCWYANSRQSIGFGKPAPVPSNLDYELWQGPSTRKAYKDNLIHYNWWWHWHWGAGEILNNGVHYLDMARWGLGVDYPTKVTATGGRYHWKDDQETPDTLVATYEFPDDKTVAWEGRSCNPRGIEGSSTGISFHGEMGSLVIGSGNEYVVYDNDNNVIKRAESGSVDATDTSGLGFDLDKDHHDHFIKCIQNSQRSRTHIADANISVHNCHLGNIAYRTGRTIYCDPHDGKIIGDKEAMNYWTKEYEPGWKPTV
ncbi:MAG: Gfo/Idh/MocA family oxidoreductase [Balneolaceae bacterium]|nr:Gfo/Idh/MocA family oxidoreductase [Balneolaceae bacterium]